MGEQQIDITKLTVMELESLAYKQVKLIQSFQAEAQRRQQIIAAIETELAKRQAEAPKE